MLAGLIRLSEGQLLEPDTRATLVADGPSFVDRAGIGWVVVDRLRAPEALRQFALQAFELQFVRADGPLELYRPARAPAAPRQAAAPPAAERFLTRRPAERPRASVQ
jgi:hypothetical protein